MKTTIHVTDRHIERGIAGSPTGCAIAIAGEEALPEYEVHMGLNYLGLVHLITGEFFLLPSAEARNFVEQFDSWKATMGPRPQPTSFEIEIPDQETRHNSDCAVSMEPSKRFEELGGIKSREAEQNALQGV